MNGKADCTISGRWESSVGLDILGQLAIITSHTKAELWFSDPQDIITFSIISTKDSWTESFSGPWLMPRL